jgi:DNA-directed RNA polymerase subunit beta
MSEKVVRDDIFTSIHIEKFQLEVRDTKKGEEELTSEIPNVNEDSIKNLNENGVIKIGSRVIEGDIIIGKITPKIETDLTPEEKLLRAIFGDKAGDVKDTSLRVPSSSSGVIINVNIFSKFKKDKSFKLKFKNNFDLLKNKYKKSLLLLRDEMILKIFKILNNKVCLGIYHKSGTKVLERNKIFDKKSIEENLFPKKNFYDNNIFEELDFIKSLVLDN